jgi:hypothetical protein
MVNASDAFTNKFLYKRNEIQAYSIDTILKKSSLFAGVGAAHLPGERGVIEMLRKMGYKLRPVMMGVKNDFQKNAVDKLKVPVIFINNAAENLSYSVDVPGTLYKMASDVSGLDRRQYADMSNGSYYLVTSIPTHASILGNSKSQVLKKVDSLLYENIPGKILKKTLINKNGFNGYDIINKTRRGDLQRYQIFVTPFEVLVFKISGKENYIEGAEAQKFFSSIQLKEQAEGWIDFEPKHGGFTIKLPQIPHQFFNTSSSDNIDRWEYEAVDKTTGDVFFVLKKSVNNFRFLDEDSFDLSLMEESFKSSEFIKSQVISGISSFKGYPALDVNASLKNGGIIKAKFIINGPHYYLVAVKSENPPGGFKDFFSSFNFTNYKYQPSQTFVDTFLQYTVSTPVIPELEETIRALTEKIGSSNPYRYGASKVDSYWPKTKNALFKSDNTGEVISVAMQQYPNYFYVKDSSVFWQDEINDYLKKTDFILAKKEFLNTENGLTGYKLILRDTNSSRQINRLLLLKNDRLYRIIYLSDTLNKESDFVKNFYQSFRPLNTLPERNIFTSTVDEFLKDFFSSDSTTHAMAQAAISNIYFKKEDIPKLLNTINKLKFSDKDYFESKSRFIAELGYIRDSAATLTVVKALKSIYNKSGDSSTFQNAVIKALAKNKTKQSYRLLKQLLLQDPPVFTGDYEYLSFFNDISDSLFLAKQLLPDVLQLSSIKDYEDGINALLIKLIDSNYITAKNYKNYFTKLYFNARVELKKQQGRDEKILEEENDKDDEQKNYPVYNAKSGTDLKDYAVLLMPFYNKPQVKIFFNKLLYSKDASLQLSIAVLLLRNNIFVPDSILNNLAAKDEYRSKLYKALDTVGLLQKFPKQFNSQIQLSKSILLTDKRYNKVDSIVYLSGKQITFNDKKGVVHFFKYRVKKEDEWKIGISGLQPVNINETSSEGMLVKMTDKKIKANEPLQNQLDTQLKRLLFSQSKSGKNFYENENYSRFKNNDF